MKILAIVCVAAALALSASGQTNSVKTADAAEKGKNDLLFKVFQSEIRIRLCAVEPTSPECQNSDPIHDMNDAYLEIVRTDPEQTKKLIARAIDRSTLQLVIVAQNQRIIELLEQIAKKKP
jgi:uncharacterized membrane protein